MGYRVGRVSSHAVSKWSRSPGCRGFRGVFWVRRDFSFFFFERTRAAASMRLPCFIYLSISTHVLPDGLSHGLCNGYQYPMGYAVGSPMGYPMDAPRDSPWPILCHPIYGTYATGFPLGCSMGFPTGRIHGVTHGLYEIPHGLSHGWPWATVLRKHILLQPGP